VRSVRSPGATLARLAAGAGGGCARIRIAARDFLRGCVGLDGYARYLAHHERHHAGQAPLTRAAFFRRELSARWDGLRRCC